jgi:outer membrane protein
MEKDNFILQLWLQWANFKYELNKISVSINMKMYVLNLIMVCGLFHLSMAQSATAKVGYVDSDYILGQIPEYKSAQSELDKLSLQWQKDIEDRFAEVEKLYRIFRAEAVLLTDDMKQKRELELQDKEQEVRELQKKRFGVDGEIYKKRQELVFNAIKAVAEKNGFSFILDKSGALTLLYVNPKYDKSDDVLILLGYKK